MQRASLLAKPHILGDFYTAQPDNREAAVRLRDLHGLNCGAFRRRSRIIERPQRGFEICMDLTVGVFGGAAG